MFIKMMIITIYQFYCVQERVTIPVIENYHDSITSNPEKTVVTLWIGTICIVIICSVYTQNFQ